MAICFYVQQYLYSWFRWRYEVFSICRSDGVVDLFPVESCAISLFQIVSSNLRGAVGHGWSAQLADCPSLPSWVCGVRQCRRLERG